MKLPRRQFLHGAPYGREGCVTETPIKSKQLRCLPGRVMPPVDTICNPTAFRQSRQFSYERKVF
jgi:hypothetical protein